MTTPQGRFLASRGKEKTIFEGETTKEQATLKAPSQFGLKPLFKSEMAHFHANRCHRSRAIVEKAESPRSHF
jgi:hypothetical protein